MNARFIPTIQHYTYREDGRVKATVRHSIDDSCNICEGDAVLKAVKIVEKDRWKTET